MRTFVVMKVIYDDGEAHGVVKNIMIVIRGSWFYDDYDDTDDGLDIIYDSNHHHHNQFHDDDDDDDSSMPVARVLPQQPRWVLSSPTSYSPLFLSQHYLLLTTLDFCISVF